MKKEDRSREEGEGVTHPEMESQHPLAALSHLTGVAQLVLEEMVEVELKLLETRMLRVEACPQCGTEESADCKLSTDLGPT